MPDLSPVILYPRRLVVGEEQPLCQVGWIGKMPVQRVCFHLLCSHAALHPFAAFHDFSTLDQTELATN